MSNEVITLALKSSLQEIQNACPDVTSTFIFKNGKILSQENTNEENAIQTVAAYDTIAERTDIIDGLENITIQSAEGKVNITAINDIHLATVSSNEADEKYVNTLTRILIPIVIKLVEQIQPVSKDNETIIIDQSEPEEDTAEETVVETEETSDEIAEDIKNYQPNETEIETVTTELDEETEEAEPEVNYEPLLPEPPVTQLIIENLKGFRVPSDTVRVDEEVITQWNELYSDNKIDEVEVEAMNGKTTRCKVKPIKKSKDAGKGIIKMPEKIQLSLEAAAGELVTVKPAVE
ncbi:hypothetical protein AC478_01050 [miscellaneous Crenarchaeota group-1 archaeon SG8-32-3]|uniref:Uncharacterized protein n=1 Tax=miscellaneous Crenarchaeota group-1 archaeon SG8-32-3 TaxID=1685125 RepID=A0A0M0BU68_9ARCH|nr:MAG: hypothetical protein AC478_01050 [miscellaneous Crenarchaeota group-1 archaeon SG8-32-3]